MPEFKAFFDTNVLLYLLSSNSEKADRAEAVIQSGGLISVQVLNEIASVACRKLAMPWTEINEVLALIRSLCETEPLTVETHERGVEIAERYKLNIYDAMIIAAALLADCDTLYSEDMHNGLLIEDKLRIHNPFAFQTPL